MPIAFATDAPAGNHRQAVRHERPTLIHTSSARSLSLGTLHPSIMKTRPLAFATGGESGAGKNSRAGAKATSVVPATKARRSIIMRLLLPVLRGGMPPA